MTHYHDYITLRESAEAKVEICRECKKQLITKKDRLGRIDNDLYLKEHVRDTAQPGGRTGKIFERFYGHNEAKKTS